MGTRSLRKVKQIDPLTDEEGEDRVTDKNAPMVEYENGSDSDSDRNETDLTALENTTQAIENRKRLREMLDKMPPTEESGGDDDEEEVEEVIITPSPTTPDEFLNSFYDFHKDAMRARDCNRIEKYVTNDVVSITSNGFK